MCFRASFSLVLKVSVEVGFSAMYVNLSFRLISAMGIRGFSTFPSGHFSGGLFGGGISGGYEVFSVSMSLGGHVSR